MLFVKVHTMLSIVLIGSLLTMYRHSQQNKITTWKSLAKVSVRTHVTAYTLEYLTEFAPKS